MLITIFAVISAFLIGFFMTSAMIDANLHLIFALILTMSGAVLLGSLFLNTTILNSFETLEQKLVPNIITLVRQDRLLHLGRLLLFLFVFISIVYLILMPLIRNLEYQDWFLAGWVVFLGIALDILRDSWHRLTNFLNPSYLVKRISDNAISAIKNDKSDLLTNSLDGLAEVGLRAAEKSKLALSTQVLQNFPPIVHAFLGSAKSISHTSHDLNTPQGAKTDEASFMIFYLLQRLELINDRALRDRLETVCRQMIMTMGKIIVYSAKFDLSMVSFPTHFLTKFGLKALQHHFDEVAVLTTSTLMEIAKTILTDIDVTYAELEEPFRAIINGLDAIAKSTFRKHKETSIKVLIQPFIDLKALFQTEKMAHHRDTPTILQEIDRVLDEYTVLEQVMQTMPPLTELGNFEGTGQAVPPSTV